MTTATRRQAVSGSRPTTPPRTPTPPRSAAPPTRSTAAVFRFQTGWGTEKYTLSADGTQWSDAGYLYGAGGGLSSQFARPDYQQGVVPDSYGTTRAVPDVGLDADPTTGMLVGQTQRFGNRNAYDEYRIGGTSLASPLFAGMTAAAQRSAVTADNPEGRLGFLNPLIYSPAVLVLQGHQRAPR